MPGKATGITSNKKLKAESEKKVGKRRRDVKSPVVQVKDKFGSKENLIKEVKKLFDKTDLFSDHLSADKGLERVSNRKLLRLHALASEVKEKFGNRKKLLDQYLKVVGKENIKTMPEKLSTLTLGRLLDIYRRAEKQSRKS